MKKELFIVMVLLVSCAFYMGSCERLKTMKKNGKSDAKIKYFANFVRKSTPIKPLEELTKEEALSKDVYGIAYYNDVGKISAFKIIINHNINLFEEYEYYNNGKLMRVTLTNSEGQVYITNYDREGRRI